MNNWTKRLTILFFMFALTGYSYGQDNAREFNFLVGQRARDLDRTMQNRGYDHVRTSKSGYDAYSNWWNDNMNKCVTVRVSNGEVRSVVNVPDVDCDRGRNANSYGRNSNKNRGYNDYERIDDIEGLSVEKAIERLGQRGFVKVDQFKESGKTHRIFYNRETRQCIDVRSMHEKVGQVSNSSRCRK